MQETQRIDLVQGKIGNTHMYIRCGIPNVVNCLITVILFISLLTSCNTKPKEEEKITHYFTINDIELNMDMTAIPDSLDKEVYQAVVNQAVRFQAPPAKGPDINQWYIDGNEIVKGKEQFEHIFDLTGLYQIKHCHGLYNCATRYVFVRNPTPVVEEIPGVEEEARTLQPIKRSPANESRKPKNESMTIKPEPLIPPTPLQIEKPVEKPIEKPVAKPVGKPPESYKNSANTGFSSGSYKADCAKWVESASIKLKPKEFCLLHTAVLYSNSKGKVKVNLTDGGGYNESMSIVVTEGKTQFAFSDLIPVLYPDRVYTLTMSGVAGTDGLKPKIANISSCTSSPKTTSALPVEYGTNSVLFDINYKLK